MAPLAASSSSPLQPLDWSCLAASLLAARRHGDTVPISATYAPDSSSVLHHSPLLLLLLISFADSPYFPDRPIAPSRDYTIFCPEPPVPSARLLASITLVSCPPRPPVFPHAISSFSSSSSSSSFSSFSSLLLTFTPLKHNPTA